MTRRPHASVLALTLAPALACESSPTTDVTSRLTGGSPPIAGAEPADHLIHPEEAHFARLFKLTSGGENAEGYFSFAGDRLVLQRRNPEQGIACDRIFVTEADGGLEQVSNGRGTTTCGYFLPGDGSVLFASTQARHASCPPPPDRAQGYVWALYPEHDVWLHDLGTGEERPLIAGPGYDAEATVSPRGDRIVFTSTRSGDVELWTCALDGSDLFQVTDELGYDGGAFFSHDGEWLVFRTTSFAPHMSRGREVSPHEQKEQYRRDLAANLVRPSHMEIMVVRPDGRDRRQVTHLGSANFAPFFYPDDERILFASNHHSPYVHGQAPNFDLFAIGFDGEGLERITAYEGFDAFPMFSPDGHWLVFASNRGGSVEGETNLFLAEWQ